VSSAAAELRSELGKVAREMLAAGAGWSQLAGAGWLGLEVAEDLGGSAATFAEVAVIAQELGRAAASVGYLGTAVLGVGALQLLDNPGAADLLARVAEGRLRLAVALPPGDAVELGFRLSSSSGRLQLSGAVEFVPDAGTADQLVIPALGPDGEPVIVLAGTGQPGLRVEPRQLVDASREFAAVSAVSAPVDPDAVWRFRCEPWLGVGCLLDRAALAVACDCLGVAEAMLDATVAYARMRRQFGRPIGSFQAVKHACADMLVQISIGRELLAAGVDGCVSSDPEGWIAVSMAKSFLGTLAVEVAGKAMQLHGGFGYTWESGVPAYLKRAVLDRALFGSPAAHRARLASRYVAPVA
jgi:alkylation response protein AidB-like acyl-CoA dehydrogenase